MKNNRLPVYYCIFVMLCLLQLPARAEDGTYPDISGAWVGLNEQGQETEAVFLFEQNEKHLAGTFTDSKDGKVLVEGPLIGYIDKHGGVIFDLQFGRVKSTNRLQLSNDQNMLEGTFINTMGNEGPVHIRRKIPE